MVEAFIKNSLLLLFVIATISSPPVRVKINGTALGVVSVLFVSVAVGSLNLNLMLPDIIFTFGAVLYVYILVLSNISGFLASIAAVFEADGWKTMWCKE